MGRERVYNGGVGNGGQSMKPEELALLECVEIPFDILKICDTGFGWHSRKNALACLANLDEPWGAAALKEKLDLYS